MAPPRPTITPNVGVPKVSFRTIIPPKKEYDGVDDKIAQHYGYNEVSEVTFERPDHYIRYVEPVEADLSTQVEYDMDEQDDEWLNAMNLERTKDQDERVSSETFEIIVDRLEKEWYDLMKRVPKPDQALPSEDSTCAVCDDGEGENANAIVFCDGCNLAVHQDCYGVPYIPEGQWLCRKCTVAPESRVECILCPNEGGAFKQTSNGKWAHLLCAIWVPECILGNPTFMEPIENSDKIPKQRWKLVCSICKVKQGACIQCNKNTCVTAFHVSCARRQKLLSPMKSHGEGELQAFCEKHLPADMRVNRVVPSSPLVSTTPASPVRSPKKAPRVQVQSTGPPLVPAIIVENIMQYTARIKFRKKYQFLLAVCKYWSLKREARRGAPLLKRLHLEPWATSTAGKLQADEEKLKYLHNLHRLRADLERVRIAVDLIRRREEQKQIQAQTTESLLVEHFLPFDAELRKTWDTVVALDRNKAFMNPVPRTETDYYTVITKPMDWLEIFAKIEQHEYLDTQTFVDDINLVLDNAITWIKKGETNYKAAVRIKNNIQPILAQFQNNVREKIALWKAYDHWEEEGTAVEPCSSEHPPINGVETGVSNIHPIDTSVSNPMSQQSMEDTMLITPGPPCDPANPPLEEDVVPETPDQEVAKPELPADKLESTTDLQLEAPVASESLANPTGPLASLIGDMEPFPPVLRMLQDQSAVAEEIPYILNDDPLGAFFTFDRPILKPPPPAPRPPPKSSRKSKKRASAPRGDPASARATRTTARTDPVSPQHMHPQRVVLLVRDPLQAQFIEGEVQVPPSADAELELEPGSASTPTGRGGVKRKRQDSEPAWGQVVENVDAHDSFKASPECELTYHVLTLYLDVRLRLDVPTGYYQVTAFDPSIEPKRVRTTTPGNASRQPSQIPFAETTTSMEPNGNIPIPSAEDSNPSLPTAQPAPSGPPRLKLRLPGERVKKSRSKPKGNGDSSSELSELSEAEAELGEEEAVEKTSAEVDAEVDADADADPDADADADVDVDADADADADADVDADVDADAEVDEAKVDELVTADLPLEPSGVHRDLEGEPIHYESGTLVWAKHLGFPWYPAVIVDPSEDTVPPAVSKLFEKALEKSKVPGPMYLAQFYDDKRTWQVFEARVGETRNAKSDTHITCRTWAGLDKLTMLGEIPDIDQKYLHQVGKNVKKGEIQRAYDLALNDMETPEEAEKAKLSTPTVQAEEPEGLDGNGPAQSS
ncbi:NuA3 HAT complex component NTO1 [Ceratobasidium sp. AG-Ba]|nr:NuA3 HAT complex component NTO1 [Ceratobasidium sp. AG-Ba]QRW02890.1 NuA3 HAT complex component NTO1 [Ceratobasidium sp. AG-Ba]